MKPILLLAAIIMLVIASHADASSLGVQDPGSMKSGDTAPSFEAGRTIRAHYWRVIVNAQDPTYVAIKQISDVRRAGFEPVVTIGGAFAGGVPSVLLIASVAPYARYFTIYNEPDCTCGEGGTISPEDYRTMFAAARDTIRKINPSAKVLICDCTAQADRYLRIIAARGPIANDGLAWHPYTHNFGPPSTARGDIRRVKAIAKKMGIHRLWATEFGFPPTRPGFWWGAMFHRLQNAGVSVAFAYNLRGSTEAWDTALLNEDGSTRFAQQHSLETR